MSHGVSRILSVIIIMISGLLSACGPRMSTVIDYYPPVTDSGMRCVAIANQDRAACDSANRTALEQCKERAVENADRAFQRAKNNYTRQLELYIKADERYEHDFKYYQEQKRLLIRDGELEYIRCSDDVKMQKIAQFPNCKKFLAAAEKRAKKLHAPESPVKPYAPNRNAIYNRFVASCNNVVDNCEQAFNQSYRSCGGTITTRQVCISNCN